MKLYKALTPYAYNVTTERLRFDEDFNLLQDKLKFLSYYIKRNSTDLTT